jgi:hypothetical protein
VLSVLLRKRLVILTIRPFAISVSEKVDKEFMFYYLCFPQDHKNRLPNNSIVRSGLKQCRSMLNSLFDICPVV